MSSRLFAINVSVVLCDQDKFLVVKRADDEEVFPGYWGIPGGSVEQTDLDLKGALKRECKEELGVFIEDLSIISDEVVIRDNKRTLYVVYKGKLQPGTNTPTPKDGTAAVEWKAITEIRALRLTPKTKDIIEEVAKTINQRYEI